MIGIRITDPAEEKIPNLGLIKVQDTETESEFWADMSSANHRESLTKKINEKWNNFQNECLRNQFDVINVKTNADYVEPLMSYFNKREKRN